MKTYKVYYINLEKSTERRAFMENQFNDLQIPITRFPAVYGKEQNKDILKIAKKNHKLFAHYPYLNDGEIGLNMTYKNLWSAIANQKEDFAIILEDDALIINDFFKNINTLLNNLSSNDFVDISGRKGFYPIKKNKLTTTYVIPPLQTTGQVIGKKGAENFLKNISHYYAPIDVVKQDIYKHKVHVMVTNKAFVTSNDKNIGGTTIQQKTMPQIHKIIREIIRPLWQLMSFFLYKTPRFIKNYIFYKKIK